MKKQLLVFLALFPLAFSSLSLNAAPPSFPTAGQAFKKIYSGNLSPQNAQTQPWYEGYDKLYKTMNNNQSDPAIITLLTNLQQQTTTPEAALTQFQTAQKTLKANADNVFSS